MPENAFVLPSHLYDHSLDYPSLKIILPLKALPLYFLAPIVVDNSDVGNLFFKILLKFLNFTLFYSDVSEGFYFIYFI